MNERTDLKIHNRLRRWSGWAGSGKMRTKERYGLQKLSVTTAGVEIGFCTIWRRQDIDTVRLQWEQQVTAGWFWKALAFACNLQAIDLSSLGLGPLAHRDQRG